MTIPRFKPAGSHSEPAATSFCSPNKRAKFWIWPRGIFPIRSLSFGVFLPDLRNTNQKLSAFRCCPRLCLRMTRAPARKLKRPFATPLFLTWCFRFGSEILSVSQDFHPVRAKVRLWYLFATIIYLRFAKPFNQSPCDALMRYAKLFHSRSVLVLGRMHHRRGSMHWRRRFFLPGILRACGVTHADG